MILFIAEKPSVAKEYAEMLTTLEGQSFSKKDGYFESSKYFISWCYGHLITLAEPSDYGWEDWDINKLPMVPSEWKYNIKNDSGVKAQFKTIKFLISKSDSIVNGADPDREGELIVRLLLHVAGANKVPLFRFWNRSMTYKDLSDAWLSKVPATQYNNLYSSASCRQRADWLIGMNLSRVYSIKSAVKGLSIGRVQTPTLALIVQRDFEIENWKPSFFNELIVSWKGLNFNYIGGSDQNRNTVEFVTESEKSIANNLLKKLENKSANLLSIESTKENASAPLFYNLADLQKDANNKYGYSADKSLSLVQSLYEKKLLSYPRTDCNYLTEEMYEDSYRLMLELNTNNEFLNHLNTDPPKAFNSKKVTAHTALVPVSELKQEVAPEELNIYNLVRDRFVKAFGATKITDVTTFIIIEGTTTSFFKHTHKHVSKIGWSVLEKSEETTVPFPLVLTIGTSSAIEDVQLIEKERTKPKYFTDATILSAMENVSKQIDTDELKGILKQKGIGTPATRSGILEQLKRRGYIDLKGKNLISTEKGRSLIEVVDPKTKSAEMTAEWELQLQQIESGEISWKIFYDGIVSYTSQIVDEVRKKETLKITTANNNVSCPDCKNSSMILSAAGAFCNADKGGCGLKLFKSQYGKKLSDKAFNDLLFKRKTSSIKMKNKNGKEYKAAMIRSSNNVSLKFD